MAGVPEFTCRLPDQNEPSERVAGRPSKRRPSTAWRIVRTATASSPETVGPGSS